MTLLVFFLQVSMAEFFGYQVQDGERAEAITVQPEENISLSDQRLFRINEFTACRTGSYVYYDRSTQELHWYRDGSFTRLDTGRGGGPRDVNVVGGLHCDGNQLAWFDKNLLRFTVLDLQENAILFQATTKDDTGQIFLQDGHLYYFNENSILDGPLEWLKKIDTDNGDVQTLYTVTSKELGKGIMLGGRAMGSGSDLCYLTIFSGFIGCFDLPDASLRFAVSPINKQDFIEIVDHSHRLGTPRGSAIGKRPEDTYVNFSIALTDDYIITIPMFNGYLSRFLDLYDRADGRYQTTLEVPGGSLHALSAYENRLYAIFAERETRDLFMIAISPDEVLQGDLAGKKAGG